MSRELWYVLDFVEFVTLMTVCKLFLIVAGTVATLGESLYVVLGVESSNSTHTVYFERV
jgi:hypothetical protein